jgi:hypothetical protein
LHRLVIRFGGLVVTEIRWLKDEHGIMQLQQRTRYLFFDASGVACQFSDWSEWVPVPVVDDIAVCMEEFGLGPEDVERDV